MFICQKSQGWGLGPATAAKVLHRCDSICKPHGHPYTFSGSSFHTYPSVSGIEPIRNPRKSSAKEKQRAERDQLIKSLKESPGKRDARNFLKHFDTPPPKKQQSEDQTPATPPRPTSDAVERAHHNEWRLTRTGVNLGNLYEPTKAIQNSPVFAQQPLPEKPLIDKNNDEPLHLALVKLRQPQTLDDDTLGGIALTLSQMARLGLNIAVVVDCDGDMDTDSMELNPAWLETVRHECARIVDALEEYNEPGAFAIDQALTYHNTGHKAPDTSRLRQGVEVKNNHLLFPPIEDGIIPVIPPLAYDSEFRKVRVRPDDVLLALTREFAGISTTHSQEGPFDRDEFLREQHLSLAKPVLDRIIILDPLGGIPSEKRADGAHVFINLEAEYKDVQDDLRRIQTTAISNDMLQIPPESGNQISKFAKAEVAAAPGLVSKDILNGATASRHLQNLHAVQKALKILPSSSSALIIDPAEAAISSQAAFMDTPSTGVRTRRSKNPLIHNLLTDKPMISSSLPGPLVNRPLASAAPNPSTFLKKGIPVTMIPDPRTSGLWRPPSHDNPSIELDKDPRINFPRLVDLIDDSFRRKLDARHYLERIRGRVAGIIIAGDYEGGAICTWETAPSLNETTFPPNSPMWVPYLDKFAVLTQSQGSGGVADIVWGALTRSCFPSGVVWRSRTSNPVNKWYFERAVGMWNLPDDQWTLFWTTEGVVEEWSKSQMQPEENKGKEMTRWDAYVDVCGGVVPSWADKHKRPD